jgi:hypothetical protein
MQRVSVRPWLLITLVVLLAAWGTFPTLNH